MSGYNLSPAMRAAPLWREITGQAEEAKPYGYSLAFLGRRFGLENKHRQTAADYIH